MTSFYHRHAGTSNTLAGAVKNAEHEESSAPSALSAVHKILWAILAFAILLRLAAALILGDKVVVLPGTFDQVSYHTLALRLVSGHGFTFPRLWWPLTRPDEPTAHWSYLYTLYLAGIYRLFGPHPLIARLLQATLVGFLHPLLAYLLGRRLFGPRVGLVAAGWTALYPYFVYYSATLMTEPFYITGILATLYLTMRLAEELRRGQAWGWAAGLGMTLAATVLLRQVFLLFLPFLLIWLGWATLRTNPNPNPNPNPAPNPARQPHLILSTAIILALLALFILPFTAYNYARFHRFVLLNTNAGFAFFWGNHPIYGDHFRSLLPADGPSYQDLIPPELRSLDEAAMEKALLKRGIGFIVDDPIRFVRLSITRIPPYFKFWPDPDSAPISNVARVLSFAAALPFILIGLFLALRGLWRRCYPQTGPDILLTLVFILVYSGIHVLTWTLIRYRLPVDAVLLIYASLALVTLWHRLRRRFSPSTRLMTEH